LTDVINNYIKRIASKSGHQRIGNSTNSLNRKYFSEETKEKVLHRQKNRCTDCKKLLTIMDFDHINGNRSDNSQANYQALCPTCHAYKTRTSL